MILGVFGSCSPSLEPQYGSHVDYIHHAVSTAAAMINQAKAKMYVYCLLLESVNLFYLFLVAWRFLDGDF